MATLLVIGASRGIGLETVKRALEAGHRVRASREARPPSRSMARRWRRSPAMPSTRPRVAAAVTGADAVIQSLGAAKGPQAILSGTTLFSQATRILIDAMRRKRRPAARHGYGLSAPATAAGTAALYDAILFPLILKRVYDDKDVQEQMIRASGLAGRSPGPDF